MILPIQLRECVIRPILKKINLWSANAEELLMGTAAQESKGGTYIIQEGKDAIFTQGGLGIFQMEAPTYNDMWDRVIKAPLRTLILSSCNFAEKPLATEMITNLAYAAVMCRVKYLSIPHDLPDANDVTAIGQYWKQWYNTPLGGGTVDEFVKNYHSYVGNK